MPKDRATGATRYRALVGLNYTPEKGRDEVRVEAGQEAVSLTAADVADLLAIAAIEPWEAQDERDRAAAAEDLAAEFEAATATTEDPVLAAVLDAPADFTSFIDPSDTEE